VALAEPIHHVEIPRDLLGSLQLPSADFLSRLLQGPIWGSALTVALIASAETLLCAAAVDQMHSGPRTRFDRELFAQGVGNAICGLVGSLPMTGVIVRSATNVEAGARTRLSTILHGCWLLLAVVAAPALLRVVPTAALAAVLVHTGFKLLNFRQVRELRSYGWSEVIIWGVTAATIVATDLLTGVLAGFALSLAKLVWRFSHLQIILRPDDARTILDLQGAATFLRLPKLAETLESVPPDTELHVHFERLTYIDHACLDLLMSWGRRHESIGGSLVLDWDSLTARVHGANEDAPAESPTTEERREVVAR
jgi:MFS superfamily sulfate permease-like transporter